MKLVVMVRRVRVVVGGGVAPIPRILALASDPAPASEHHLERPLTAPTWGVTVPHRGALTSDTTKHDIDMEPSTGVRRGAAVD